MSDGIVSCKQFGAFLDTQSPYYDKYIVQDFRPTESLIGLVKTGTWEAFTEAQHIFDRFKHVQPNVTKPWKVKGATKNFPLGCDENPCDKKAERIGWGFSRVTYGLQEQSWMTDLICYDQSMFFTQAVAHFEQIISKIMRPATARIQSHKIRKEMSALEGSKKWVAAADMHDFTFHWEQNADGDEIFMVMDSGTPPTSKLTPQMLQRRVGPLKRNGYLGEQPFKDMPPLIELLTPETTIWDLDKQASANVTAFAGLQGQYRFSDWGDANKYWKYAYTGQLGDFAVRADAESFRFLKLSDTRFQLVLPYFNEQQTVGIGSEVNEIYDSCIYGFSIIWHRGSMIAETLKPASINANMPYSSRDFGGTWTWGMHDLGADKNGCVIENIRGNKGLFWADFVMAFKPEQPKWSETIFHQLAPACTLAVATCAVDPGYPEQFYSSTNDTCDVADECFVLTPSQASNQHYKIAANTIRVNGFPVVHGAIDETSLGDLVTALNASSYAQLVGTWGIVQVEIVDSNGVHPGGIGYIPTYANSTTDIQVCGEAALGSVQVTWLAS